MRGFPLPSDDRLRVCRIRHDIARWDGPFTSHGAACYTSAAQYPVLNLQAELSVPQPRRTILDRWLCL